jgi:arabinogalactan endo-1,4-beta-galactosidase
MIEFNFLNNYSFEEDPNGTATPTGWTINQIGSADELYNEVKATDSLTGQGHYHFWSAASNSVEFYLEQEITRDDFIAGKYKFSISIMGGDCGVTDIYAYAKINGTIVKKSALTINGYGNWDTTTITDIEYNGTDTFVVGIYVKCAGENNGAWGKIDDALLNSQLG